MNTDRYQAILRLQQIQLADALVRRNMHAAVRGVRALAADLRPPDTVQVMSIAAVEGARQFAECLPSLGWMADIAVAMPGMCRSELARQWQYLSSDSDIHASESLSCPATLWKISLIHALEGASSAPSGEHLELCTDALWQTLKATRELSLATHSPDAHRKWREEVGNMILCDEGIPADDACFDNIARILRALIEWLEGRTGCRLPERSMTSEERDRMLLLDRRLLREGLSRRRRLTVERFVRSFVAHVTERNALHVVSTCLAALADLLIRHEASLAWTKEFIASLPQMKPSELRECLEDPKLRGDPDDTPGMFLFVISRAVYAACSVRANNESSDEMTYALLEGVEVAHRLWWKVEWPNTQEIPPLDEARWAFGHGQPQDAGFEYVTRLLDGAARWIDARLKEYPSDGSAP